MSVCKKINHAQISGRGYAVPPDFAQGALSDSVTGGPSEANRNAVRNRSSGTTSEGSP